MASIRRYRLLPVIAFSLGAVAAHAEERFEVAAIRPNASGSPNTQINLPNGGRLIIVNATLKTLIRNAYGILGFQLAGGPPWLDGDKFDINAKTGDSQAITSDRLKPLLQNLLADRFQLKVHWQGKDGPVYALVAEKTGPKFSRAAGGPDRGMNTSKGPGKVHMKGSGVPMSELSSNLANQLGRFVVDQTGLDGEYDFVLDWDPDQLADSTGPSLFTALHEQLGLKLEPRKGQVPVLVIDSVEKPSEN